MDSRTLPERPPLPRNFSANPPRIQSQTAREADSFLGQPVFGGNEPKKGFCIANRILPSQGHAHQSHHAVQSSLLWLLCRGLLERRRIKDRGSPSHSERSRRDGNPFGRCAGRGALSSEGPF